MNQERAFEIMGENFIGTMEISNCFGISFTEIELNKIQVIPYFESTLHECRESHILFLGCPKDKNGNLLTIVRMYEIFGSNPDIQPCFFPLAWYRNMPFATQETCLHTWYLVRKNVIEESFLKTYIEQELLVKKMERRPKAVEIVFMSLLYFLVRNGQRLFLNEEVWCRDNSCNCSKVSVGLFSQGGLLISDSVPRNPRSYLGLTTVRNQDF